MPGLMRTPVQKLILKSRASYAVNRWPRSFGQIYSRLLKIQKRSAELRSKIDKALADLKLEKLQGA